MTGWPSVTPVHLLDLVRLGAMRRTVLQKLALYSVNQRSLVHLDSKTPGFSGQQDTPRSSGQQDAPRSFGQQDAPRSSGQQDTAVPSVQQTTPSSSRQPDTSAPSRSPDDEQQPPKKKRKRATKLQKAEKAGNAMVQELIAANKEARKERMDWERQLMELEDVKSRREQIVTASYSLLQWGR